VVVNVLHATADAHDQLLGVARVSLLESALDTRLASFRVHDADPADPYRMVLCDRQGRLVTRLDARDRLREVGDDLRVTPLAMPRAIAAALGDPALGEVDSDTPFAQRVITVDGRRQVVSFHALERTQGWRVAIVGPEDYYLNELRATQRHVAMGGVLLLVLVVIVGAWLFKVLRSGLRRVEDETTRMRSFRFAPSEPRAAFRDVATVLAGLEQAKTALRALGRYVPIDLVRQLYEANRDPVLGSETRELTILFTYIAGFTSVSEQLPPDRMAQLLGCYFEAMTGAVESHGGTLDKYIGDAVMALWNAPRLCATHPVDACRAALAAVAATEELFASPAWEGLPRLETRLGLHTAEVLVGHFGAPTRLSYTAFGDGVNLASRLEALNKKYGTTILVSAAVAERVAGELTLRRIDRVAVKGKSRAVDVYELLGPRDLTGPRVDAARAYEIALDAYFAADLPRAIALFEQIPGDAPSAVLLARCRELLSHPPPAGWDGVFVATSK
jgi:adenylate cyclase